MSFPSSSKLPAPQTPHFVRPEDRYCGHRAPPGLPAVLTACRLCSWRCFASAHSSSQTDPECGNFLPHPASSPDSDASAFAGIGILHVAQPVPHSPSPMYDSLFRIPVPRLLLPSIVLGLQKKPPNGPAMPSRFRFWPLCLGETPAMKSRKKYGLDDRRLGRVDFALARGSHCRVERLNDSIPVARRPPANLPCLDSPRATHDGILRPGSFRKRAFHRALESDVQVRDVAFGKSNNIIAEQMSVV